MKQHTHVLTADCTASHHRKKLAARSCVIDAHSTHTHTQTRAHVIDKSTRNYLIVSQRDNAAFFASMRFDGGMSVRHRVRDVCLCATNVRDVYMGNLAQFIVPK